MVLLPVWALRQRVILKRLWQRGAVSPETAQTLQEAEVFHPDVFPKVTEALVRKGKLGKTVSGKYYLKQDP